jgi:hypothetical protein
MPFSFAGHVALLEAVLSRRQDSVDRIESRLLNVKEKDTARRRDRPFFDAALDACVFGGPGMPPEAAKMRDQLATARLADGFEPLHRGTAPHQLDPAELLVRGYDYWNRTRWPGGSGRLRFAQTVWSVSALRVLQDLTLRLWDDGDEQAASRLHDLQRLLDAVNAAAPSGPLVRDARWLLQTALGPLTKGPAPYFRVADQIARSFVGEDATAIHGAGARLAGGHLRSQLRFRAAELATGTDSIDAVAMTRNSNSMDLGLLVWDLVPLLDAYRAACAADLGAARRALSASIVQGCSADPDLLVTRLDLLAPATMIETVFVNRVHGVAGYSAIGAAHVRMLERYSARIDELAPSLAADSCAFDPAAVTYSPLAIEYGFCGDLLSGMALDELSGNAASGIALEDLFADGGNPADKQRRARFKRSDDWARDVFARTTRALERRSNDRGRRNCSGVRDASLFVSTAAAGQPDAQEHLVVSDVALALATGATAFPRGQIVSDREEGRFLASAEANGRWFAVSKVVLTGRIAQGRDAVVTGVPQDVTDTLRLTCPGIVVLEQRARD